MPPVNAPNTAPGAPAISDPTRVVNVVTVGPVVPNAFAPPARTGHHDGRRG